MRNVNNVNMANAIEIESKCHKQSRQISELKKEIRKLRTIELEKNISLYKNQGYNVDQSISLKVAKSHLNLNEKNSETVLYVPQQDTTDSSILESLNKQRHKRRPSSVSSVGRIDKTNHIDYNTRNHSPKYDDNSYMGESYISKTFVNDVTQNDIYFQDDHPEKDIEEHISQSNEMRKITMSYLEEDYEEEHMPKTHRESRNSSRQHYKPEKAYKPSPITRSSVSTQNLISRKFTENQDPNPSNIRNEDTLSNVMSPTDLGYKFNFGDIRESKNEMAAEHHKKAKRPKEAEHKSRKIRNDITDVIDSQTHNTFDNGGYEDESFAMNFYSKKRRDNTVNNLNQTYGETHTNKTLRVSKDNVYKRNDQRSKGQDYKSKERTIDYSDNQDADYSTKEHTLQDFDSYNIHTGRSQLKKIKSKNSLKPNFDRCQKIKASNYPDNSTYNTQHSFREYQPKQKENSQ